MYLDVGDEVRTFQSATMIDSAVDAKQFECRHWRLDQAGIQVHP